MTMPLGLLDGLMSGPLGALSFHRTAEICLLVVLVGLFLLRLLARLAEQATADPNRGFLTRLLTFGGRFSNSARNQRLPNLFLLHHWRDAGEVKRAYRAASRNLAQREDALPLWLFAAETAAVHLHNWPAAIRIARRLCRCRAFNQDEKIFVVNHLKGLAATHGYHLDITKLGGHQFQPARLTAMKRANRLREKGQLEQAISLLKQLRQKNPEHLAAGVMLVRIYAEDQARRDLAEELIAELEKLHCGSRAVIDFLRNSLEDWLRAADRTPSTSSPKDARPRKAGRDNSSARLLLEAPPITRETMPPEESSAPAPDDASAPATEEGDLPPEIAELVNEGRLGTAIQQLEQQIRSDPLNLGVILQLVHVEIIHCHNLRTGERIITQIDCCPDFTDEQKALALKQLKSWREEYARLEHHPMSVRML